MKENEDNLLIADLLLRLKSLEELLIKKNIVTLEEYDSIKEEILNSVSKSILDKTIVSK